MQYKDTDRVEVRANTNLGKKKVQLTKRISKLIFHCIIVFLMTKTSKEYHIWPYLDEICFVLKKPGTPTTPTTLQVSTVEPAIYLVFFFISASLSTAFGPTWAANARSPHAAVFAAGCVPPPQKLSSPPCSWPHRRFTKTMRILCPTAGQRLPGARPRLKLASTASRTQDIELRSWGVLLRPPNRLALLHGSHGILV